VEEEDEERREFGILKRLGWAGRCSRYPSMLAQIKTS
jgi:hypothetical protein